MILEINDIHTFYGTSHVLFGISLSIDEGEVVCLLGRNGVGKTTTLRSIIGLTPPRSGDIIFAGESIVNKPTHYISRKGIGWVPDDRRIFPDLAVRRNLLLGARGDKNGEYWTLDTIYELFPKLQELDSRLGGYLSGGEQQMLAIARTLMTNPRLLLLDEPGEGLAPLIIKALGESLLKLKDLNVTMLMCEHNIGLAIGISDRAYVIDKGAIYWSGTAKELQEDEDVKKKYLML
ncbi:MAG: ABC transporter ATP-binding protein [Thermodesulfobacteriota bacterium]